MMKNKKMLIGIFSGIVAISALVFANSGDGYTWPVNAAGCDHTGVIEHYEANATTVEHWACCECHTAWADEARTIILRDGGVDKTRSNSTYQVANYYNGGAYGWEDNSIALFDNEYGFAYKHELTQPANEVFLEPRDISLDFSVYSTYILEVTNSTTSYVHYYLLNADWSGAGVEGFIESNQSCQIIIPSTVVGSGSKAYVVKMVDNDGGVLNGSVTVTMPKGLHLKSNLTSGLEVANLSQTLITTTKDDTYGLVYSFNTSDIAGYTSGEGYPNIYFKDLAELDVNRFTGVKAYIYHESGSEIRFTCWSEDWNNHGCGLGLIPSHTWTEVNITADAWNGDRSSCAIGFYDTTGLSGLVKIAIKGLNVTNYYSISHRGTDYEFIWDDATTSSTYDSENDLRLYTKEFNGLVEGFFQTIDTTTTVAEDAIYKVKVINNTNTVLNVSSTSRSWDSANGTYAITLQPNEEGWINVSAHCWNNIENPEANKGFAIRITGDNVVGSVTVSTPKLTALPYYNVSHHGTYDWLWDDSLSETYIDTASGLTFDTKTFNGLVEGFFQTIDTTTTVAEDALFKVKVVNKTNSVINVSSTSRTWDSVNGTYAITLQPNEEGWINVSAYCWNNVEKPDKNKGFAIRIAGDNIVGTVAVSQPVAAE